MMASVAVCVVLLGKSPRAAGQNFSVGGTVGGFGFAALEVPPGINNAIHVSTGFFGGAAVLADGGMVFWGDMAPIEDGNELRPAVLVFGFDGGSLALHADGGLGVGGQVVGSP